MRQRHQLYRREIAGLLALERATMHAADSLPWYAAPWTRLRWWRVADRARYAAAMLERVMHGRDRKQGEAR